MATTLMGRLLVEDGRVSAAEVEAALAEQAENGGRIGEILVRRGLDPEAVARALAHQLRLTYAPPPLDPDPEALRHLPRAQALQLRAVPLALAGRTLRVAVADPLDATTLDAIQFRTGRRVEPVVASRSAIERALMAGHDPEAVRAVLSRLEPAPDAAPPEDPDVLRQASEAPPIVALVNLVLDRAVGSGASDIHIEPEPRRVVVRIRVDGVLREVMEIPASAGAAVASRVKIMAGLDIAEKRRPQDGRSAVRVDGTRVGIRVSTLPAQDGEKVVLRLLDPRAHRRSLNALGLDPPVRRGLERALDREHGLFLVTGPTGSGKTTTLYAVLESRDREHRNIVTLEDPVEYRVDGVTQVQVAPRAGLTFAAALRSVLRQDPDIIMVGEMRDRETAETGLAAALTGHLVLSTLHTNDAPGAVARLTEMGVARYLVAGGLIGVVAQRLVRRLCDHCRSSAPVTGDELYELGLPTPTHLPRAVGCRRCDDTGYGGRVAVYELLRVDPVLREMILAGAPADDLRDAARAAGSTPLAVDAWRKVEAGLTTLEEVRPLLALLRDAGHRCRSCGARLGPDHAFCPLCGGERMRRCDCGAVLRPHWRFCGGCGRPVTVAPERVS
ncbi:MAG: type II secretion system protein GspE [Gemmatimonadetes bacterium]|nr:type II secretion system protein GspE [Gemmatimonadota bacterium]NIQ57981.1 type II secretion system protein GspE [Gemmatimonadota bacterium]NIX47158.1 type II secretion system protein GspE [Gemmatimonadota bacterium]